jgi:hypothetical protein
MPLGIDSLTFVNSRTKRCYKGALPLVGESELKPYLSAQTAFYSLNPDRDIYRPLAISPAYVRLAQSSGQLYLQANGV